MSSDARDGRNEPSSLQRRSNVSAFLSAAAQIEEAARRIVKSLRT